MAAFATDRVVAETLHHRPTRDALDKLIVPPIVPASVYRLPGEPTGPYQYGRWSNPTWSALEDALSVLEQAEVVAFPSGMAAVAALLYTQLRSGDRVLLPSDGYYTTRSFAEKFLGPLGVHIETCATAGLAEGRFAGHRVVWIETPSNPGLEICDLQRSIAAAKAAGSIVIVDNTTATPLGQRPLDYGADAVVSSDTKALNGHSDTLMGHIASRSPQMAALLRDWRKLSGSIPGPFEAWLVHRGLETLELRFDRMCATAAVLAARLSDEPKVSAVSYPGLESHPAYSLAKKQMLRFGFLIGVTFETRAVAEHFIIHAKFIEAATSFGGVRSSAECRARWGDQVAEGFVRLSVGCEPTETLWADIKQALDAA